MITMHKRAIQFMASGHQNVHIIKVLSAEAYAHYEELGFAKMPCDTNFIHLLYENQLARKLPELFPRQTVYLLYLREEMFAPLNSSSSLKLVPESNKPGGEVYPHLCKTWREISLIIARAMVSTVLRCKVGSDGTLETAAVE